MQRLGLKPILVNHTNIEMSDGDKILNDIMLLGQTMTLMGWELLMDLIVFKMPIFDMILGMDFLNRYRAEIDYRKKKVKFSLDNKDEFTFGEG